MSPGRLGDSGAGALGAGQRDPADARVGDHHGHLLVSREYVEIDALRDTGLPHQLRNGKRRRRAVLRRLDQDRVAGDEVRGGEPRNLGVRVVPRHHTQQRTDREVLDPGAVVTGQRAVGQECRAVAGVVVEDRGAVCSLAASRGWPFAHLAGDKRAQLGGMLAEQRPHPLHDAGPLRDRQGPPRLERRGGGGQRRLNLGIGGVHKGLQHLSGGRVGDLVRRRLGHVLFP